MTGAFAAGCYDIGGNRSDPLRLAPVDGYEAALGLALAAIDPWARVGRPAASLEAYWRRRDPTTFRFAILADGELAGAVAVRDPFMRGPYLELLAVLPAFQGHGIGRAVMDWLAGEGLKAGGSNLWLCVTDWNAPARAFYEGLGFEAVGPIPDLAVTGTTEIFLRRRLAAPGA
ncbi:GNAT family N-acetyltransferase [Prosthecodimorpha staleyi]|uniref:GNAT family N-acetyltransferase n=1 Tax=Prosthecodimorpha staleyi TaxID=2840188 RepID=A0A947GDC4_9HYPH|nr:GNAT family N-acetyltransferase [Prosthecodimorpha staleyi]MBT9290136.1 GNAT family N-acetyltransferase [Prosthecodimorpha staleyi]